MATAKKSAAKKNIGEDCREEESEQEDCSEEESRQESGSKKDASQDLVQNRAKESFCEEDTGEEDGHKDFHEEDVRTQIWSQSQRRRP